MATHKLNFPSGDQHFKSTDWDNYQILQYRESVKFTRVRGVGLDCGAHAGIMTRRMSADFKTVHAFEPVHHQLLQQNIQDLKNVTIHPIALSDSSGPAHMLTRRENSGDCELSGQGLPIQTRTIDDFEFEDVNFIKMDIQGSELPALKGARNTILECHPTLMIEVEAGDPWRTELELTLKDWDYTLRYNKNADWIYTWDGWRYC